MSIPSEMLNLLNAREQNFSLPGRFYNDPDFYSVDLDAIFYRRWILAGFECELAEPGDYLTLTVGRSSVIVLRDDERNVRAFHNTCRHRGSKICLTEKGKAKKIDLPLSPMDLQSRRQALLCRRMHDDFDPSAISLGSVNVETLEGMIYICLADKPPSFDLYRSKLQPYLAPYDLKNVKLVHSADLVENANWKLVVENRANAITARRATPSWCRPCCWTIARAWTPIRTSLRSGRSAGPPASRAAPRSAMISG